MENQNSFSGSDSGLSTTWNKYLKNANPLLMMQFAGARLQLGATSSSTPRFPRIVRSVVISRALPFLFLFGFYVNNLFSNVLQEAAVEDKNEGTSREVVAGLEQQLAIAYSIVGICSYAVDHYCQVESHRFRESKYVVRYISVDRVTLHISLKIFSSHKVR